MVSTWAITSTKVLKGWGEYLPLVSYFKPNKTIDENKTSITLGYVSMLVGLGVLRK